MSLSPDLLLHGYSIGIFPMAEHRDDPEIFWVDPRRRGVFPLEGFHLSRSLARRIRRGGFEVSTDRDFAGVVAGCAAGWVLGRVLFTLPGDNPLANAGTGVIALAGVLVTYGLTELIEGYGFIAAFFMGLVLRRKEAEHEYHGRLHSFSSALEHSVTAVLLVLLGGAIPALLGYLDWQHALLGVALIFIIRPISGMLALWGDPMSLRQRGVVAFYGVRGIGSIYYLAYAGGQLNLVDEGALWATVTFTILLSTIVHGFSAGSVVWAATHDENSEIAPEKS